MNRQITFTTPENIEVTYELAGIGTRFLAVLLDHLLQIGILIAVGILGVAAASVFSLGGLFSGAPLWFNAIFGLLSFAIIFGYFPFYEILWAGRTPGKKFVGLRVVKDGGEPIDPYAALVRNLVRIADFLLLPIYGSGLIAIFLSREYKRLGDWAAGTLVVKDRANGFLDTRPVQPPVPSVSQWMTTIRHLDALTIEEFRAVRRFGERRHRLTPPVQGWYAMQIGRPLLERLAIPVQITHELQYVDFLEALERRYMEEFRLI